MVESPTVGCFLRLSIGRFNLVKGDQKTDSVCKTMPGIKLNLATTCTTLTLLITCIITNYNDDDDKNDNDGNSNNNNMINQWANKALH